MDYRKSAVLLRLPDTVQWLSVSLAARGGRYSDVVRQAEVGRIALFDSLPAAHCGLTLLLVAALLQLSNRSDLMNTQIIERSSDLETTTARVLSDHASPEFRLRRSKAHGWDFEAEVALDGKVHRFGVDCKLRPTVRDVDRLAETRVKDTAPLLATVKATESLVERCKEREVSCVDLNGRIWLRSTGVLVDRRPPAGRDRFRTAEPTANLFSVKGSRLARALLAFPGRSWLTTCAAPVN